MTCHPRDCPRVPELSDLRALKVLALTRSHRGLDAGGEDAEHSGSCGLSEAPQPGLRVRAL
jgi:hypothetical protein